MYSPKDGASLRTRNRLREHNFSVNSVVARANRCPAFAGEPAILLNCDDDGCNWLGWIPVREIEFKPLCPSIGPVF